MQRGEHRDTRRHQATTGAVASVARCREVISASSCRQISPIASFTMTDTGSAPAATDGVRRTERIRRE